MHAPEAIIPQLIQTGGESVRILRYRDELEAIRPAWERMQSHPQGDIDFLLALVEYRKNIKCPYVLVAYYGREPVAIMAGRIETVPITVRVGYKAILTKHTDALVVDRAGVLGNASEETLRHFLTRAEQLVHDGEVDAIFFNALVVGSPLHRLVRSRNSLMRDHFAVENEHWELNMPKSYDDFFSARSQSARKNLRRFERRLSESFGGDVVIKTHRRVDELASSLDDCEKVAAKSYQRGLRVGFINDRETQAIARAAAQRGQYRAFVMYITGQPAAFWIGYIYGNTFFGGYTAYDPKYTDYRLGTLVFLHGLKQLYEREHVTKIDFGLGDADYKREYCNNCWLESSTFLFARNWRGLGNAAAKSISNASQMVGKTYSRWPVVRRLKKMWRRHAAKNTITTS
jgi:CelD/BcsL family acetyltransferase involved in cellulose biosynthesis